MDGSETDLPDSWETSLFFGRLRLSLQCQVSFFPGADHFLGIVGIFLKDLGAKPALYL